MKKSIKPLTNKQRQQELKTGYRICTSCKRRKKLDKFHKQTASANGRMRRCVICVRKEQKQRYKKEEVRIRKSAENRRWRLQKRYGISEEQYNEMYKRQNGKCAICKNKCPKFGEILSVDHCHVTLKIRGLLCDPCNRLLACAKDNPVVLQSAINYLQEAF